LFLNGGAGTATPAREYSKETARAIDEEISRLITEADDRVRQILTEKCDQLEVFRQPSWKRKRFRGKRPKHC
jgi:ATP-dependent Zn protease